MIAPRAAKPTVTFIDDYCEAYQCLFPEVRSFESFKNLHLGMMSEIKRKSLPAIAKVVGLENSQSLHHFLSESPWSAKQLRLQRLELILRHLQGREIVRLIDETGDRKKGKATAYVKRQYIGNLGKTENEIVAVSAYGLINRITLPLSFEVYKPKERLLEGDEYQSKPQIAAYMIRELWAMGFKFKLVLADSLYGESDGNFISVLNQLKLSFVVAIRSNHGVWLPAGHRVKYNKWRKFDRIFSKGQSEVRYIREIIFGKRRTVGYWQITTDPDSLPKNSTWWVMTQVPGVKYQEVGNLYGLRNWVEYGLKPSKNELGWADFRVTDYPRIEKWWELVCSAYLIVSLHAEVLTQSVDPRGEGLQPPVVEKFALHPWWKKDKGWKSLLTNLRLVAQPLVLFNQLKPWLKVFPIPQLTLGFPRLIVIMNEFRGAVFVDTSEEDFYFSSA